jgi:membrane-associated phospholipid phosphatase
MRHAAGSSFLLRVLVPALLLAVGPVRAQTPDSSAAPPGTVALPPVSTDPLTGETATAPPPTYNSLDARIERAVYRFDAPPFAFVMRAVNEGSFPAFAAAAPGAAGVALLNDGSYRPALRIGASEAAALGVVYALKGTVRRPRPYRTMTEIRPRDPNHTGEDPFDPNSFPSGHAAMAFAVATSLTLSDARWAVPSLAWATAVSVSRVWHGVHYPSDVLVGAAIGAGSAFGVHALLPSGGGGEATAFRVVVPF